MLIDKDLRLSISGCFWLFYASKYMNKFDPNTMSIVFDKEFDNAIYSEWTVEMKGKSYMILTHHGIWDAGHGLTHEDTYSFELFRIMDE